MVSLPWPRMHRHKFPMQRARIFSARERKKIKIPMPTVVSMYNKCMGGVDRMDQNVACCRIGIKGKSGRYFPVIAYLLNVSVQKAWIFASKGDYTGDLLAFTREIVHTYLQSYGQPARNPGRRSYLKVFRFDARSVQIRWRGTPC